MRMSRVLRKLRAGEMATCFKINLADSRPVEIAAQAGFDCLWADMEHVPNDYLEIEKQVVTAKCYDADLMVRVSRGSYSDYVRPLEMDAAGIMVPHVMSLEDAKRVIHMTRFPPVGRRAVDGGNADGAYCTIPLTEYLRQANERRFVMLQIEDPEPLDDLEAIARLDGYDVLFFGPGDFSCGIGAPGEWNHPLILETRNRIAQLAARYGKYAGTVGSPSDVPRLLAQGYRFINTGADVVGLGKYCREILDSIRQATSNPPHPA